MKYSLVILVMILSSLSAKAQTSDTPDAIFAMEIKWIAAKIGSPVDDAVHYLDKFQKMDPPDAHHAQYVSTAHNAVIIFGTDDAGNINSIECDMYATSLGTIKKAIDNMGLKPSDEAGPSGYTVYAGAYKAFLNVGEKTLSLIITSKEIIAGQ